MCGICGIVLRDPSASVPEATLRAMAGAMRHRGPDGEGYFVDGPAGLGHRRLSILDLSEAGRQPMCDQEGSLWITFNGEIYNHHELRSELAGRGHRFRSGTDSEVVVHLYQELGPACVDRLNGMFAFAIWDVHRKTLFAARDRLGIKPFYYARVPDGFVFASEIKALLRSGLVCAELDPQGLADYLTLHYCLGDKTLFRGVKRLPPASRMRVSPDGGICVEPYWSLDFTPSDRLGEDEFHGELTALLEDSVRLQLQADVPVGAHLSGGVDSSAIVSLAAKATAGPLHTFHARFAEGPAFDESAYARRVADQAGTRHHEVVPGAADLVRLLPSLVHHMDEPAAGPGLFPQYCVSQLASQHVKVVLGGQGGDELFGGYTRYLVAYLEECLRGGIDGTQRPGEEARFVVTFQSLLPNLQQLRGYEPMLRHFWSEGLFGPSEERYFRLIDRSAAMHGLVPPEVLRPDGYSPFDAFREVFLGGDTRSLINRMTRYDLLTQLPALLQVEDRSSMAASIESRVPFLDHRIAELAACAPPTVKFRGGQSKHLLRQATEHLLPAEVAQRKDKMGLPVPLAQWLRGGVVRELAGDLLSDSAALRHGMVQGDPAAALLHAGEDYGRAGWGLLALELWTRIYLDGTLTP